MGLLPTHSSLDLEVAVTNSNNVLSKARFDVTVDLKVLNQAMCVMTSELAQQENYEQRMSKALDKQTNG